MWAVYHEKNHFVQVGKRPCRWDTLAFPQHLAQMSPIQDVRLHGWAAKGAIIVLQINFLLKNGALQYERIMERTCRR